MENAKAKVMLIDDLVEDIANELNVKITGEAKGETHSMVIGRLSQSAKPFSEIIKEILNEKGLDTQKVTDFHKRVTIAWGHHSIEQHAHTSIGLENVSILAANKYFENKRLSAYLERSTRYQDFSNPSYYIPAELNEKQKEKYVQAVDYLFSTYSKVLPLLITNITENYKARGITADEKTIKKKAFDGARYLLPASTMTNFAISTNSQQFRALIHDLKSIKNNELNEIADRMQEALTKEYPSLLAKEYCVADETRIEHTNKEITINPIKQNQSNEKISIEEHTFENIQPTIKTINTTQNAEELICYEYLTKEGFDTSYVKGKVFLRGKEITPEQKKELVKKIFSYNTIEKKPHRAAENAYYWFETLVDFGAGRDLHRNRMLTWIDTEVSPEYGYAIPYYLNEEAKKEYTNALKKAFSVWVELINQGVSREIAQYLLPLATNYKVLYTLNAKELHHVAKTRTSRAAHYSYREYVHKLCEEVKQINPLIGAQLPDQYEKEL
ncbi:MAG: FAD-dependent thymidylate synthase [archaeon]|jgi:thymidylate synthase ThyX